MQARSRLVSTSGTIMNTMARALLFAWRIERALREHRNVAGHCITCDEPWPCVTVEILSGKNDHERL